MATAGAKLPSDPERPHQKPSLSVRRPWYRHVGWHVGLFLLTFLSAMLAELSRNQPLERGLALWRVPFLEPWRLVQALPFAATLMAILLAHEMGHYITARYHGVDQSLPYFIPAPTLFGTLGAVIFMHSQPRNRQTLLHVAVMGPYAGFVLAVPAAAWGLAHSIPVDPSTLPMGLVFGDSILFALLEHWFSPQGADVLLHPVGMAGWVGLFVTSLNLIPAAQLDGGHVAYALLGRFQEKLSLAVAILLLSGGMGLSLLGHPGSSGAMWILWALLLFAMGIRHPPVQDEAPQLTRTQKINASVALLLFLVTFIPVPVKTFGA